MQCACGPSAAPGPRSSRRAGRTTTPSPANRPSAPAAPPGSPSKMVYVKDGVMLREEQASDYPRINADLPDYNPRGCQKGACFVEYVYGAQRLKYPLMRKGLRAGKPVERGSGEWERVTWDE